MGLDMQQLIGEFSNEANEFLEKAETEIIELEKNPDPEKINAVFRYIHTVKGNSGMFEFQNLSRLSHALESLLGKFREGSLTINKEYIDLMLEAVDRLKLMIRELDKESSFDISSMTEQLKSAAAAEQKKTVTENIAEELTITEEDVIRAFTEDFLKEAAREAEKNHQFASVAVLDLIEQRFQSLGELAEFLSQFGMNIKMRHLLADSIPDLETPSDFLPFAFLILSEQDIKEFLKKYDLRPKFILSLYSPIQLIQSKDTNQKQEKQAAENSDSYLRVRSRLLDDLINLVGETIITRNQLFQRSAFLNDPEGGNILSRMSQLITQLHEKIMHTRLQELNSINQRIQRVVR
ncbi:MAG TPA: Hpt domain-containing protein, partial [Leptospiraceae bacterium]|nr:Hpt domain-containing protein [Leptospiraceae bacterium]